MDCYDYCISVDWINKLATLDFLSPCDVVACKYSQLLRQLRWWVSRLPGLNACYDPVNIASSNPTTASPMPSDPPLLPLPAIITIDASTLTANSASLFLYDNQTLSPGGPPITVSETVYSLAGPTTTNPSSTSNSVPNHSKSSSAPKRSLLALQP